MRDPRARRASNRHATRTRRRALCCDPIDAGPARSWPTLVLLLACVACHAVAFGVIVPRFTDVFESVDVPMPQLTILALSAARVFVAVWPLWTALLTAGAVWASRRPGVAALTVAASVVVWGLLVIAVFLPLPGLLH